MLPYLLWHRPQPDVAAQDYEARLIAFHEGLANAAPRGLVASATYRIDEVPWLRGRSGYEDWFFLDGCGALEALSQLAVSGAASPVHDGIAKRSGLSHGGLYRLVAGEAMSLDHPTVWWLTRPRGVPYETIVRDLCSRLEKESSGWHRMLMLGPAPELALVNGSRLTPTFPPGWKAVPVAHHRLWPRSGSGRSVLSLTAQLGAS